MKGGRELIYEIQHLLEQNYTPLATAQALDIPVEWVYNAARWIGRDIYDHTDELFQQTQ